MAASGRSGCSQGRGIHLAAAAGQDRGQHGGAGTPQHFADAFLHADVDGALAASVFHSGALAIPELKRTLREHGIQVRL